ncbi:unnamed protein product [Menidia menidia]|uniref:(Atlantic silverside) hypothetical protein n=1 Tax=Menidia menidia TaxID=238744 RepID=A0A8S4BHJ7_9TELE|nr:unnamed protein product [Menidia menidia]
MPPHLPLCCLSLLLLLHVAAAKPASEIQGLTRLLEAGLDSDRSALGAPEREPATSAQLSSAHAAKESALARVLEDLLRSPKRAWSRWKKGGGLRSCFGVRLERIGSFSGLGC